MNSCVNFLRVAILAILIASSLTSEQCHSSAEPYFRVGLVEHKRVYVYDVDLNAIRSTLVATCDFPDNDKKCAPSEMWESEAKSYTDRSNEADWVSD